MRGATEKNSEAPSAFLRAWFYAHVVTVITVVFWTGTLYMQVRELYSDREKLPVGVVINRLDTLNEKVGKVEQRMEKLENHLYEHKN